MHNQILVLNFKLKCFQFLSFIHEVDVKLCGVLVQGDQEALEYSYNIMKRGVPFVVVNDSGKMADAVSISFRNNADVHKMTKVLEDGRENMLKNQFSFEICVCKY